MRNLIFLLLALQPFLQAARVKELVSIEGIRDNQLIGYGIVVGLAGTGDKRQTVFAAQSLTNLLDRMGVSISPTAIQLTNTAGVMVTATLPPFSQPGQRVDITVAAIGDAKNLQGGMLLITSLKAADGQVYAVAQGAVVTGGFVAGGGANAQTVNHPTAGRVPNGAIVERGAPSQSPGAKIRLQLRQADFTTAARITAAINQKFDAPIARAENSGLITVVAPAAYTSRPVDFIASMESVTVDADRTARVVINERTGTISIGRDVRIAPVSILHGNLTVQIETAYEVVQPQPLSKGETTVVPRIGVGVKEEKARSIALKDGATVEELVRALSAIGSTARDIIAILQNLKAAGALEAEVEVI